MVALPTQNQLYAFYMARCAHHRIGKPNPHVLRLLEEDELSRVKRLEAEAAERRLPLEELEQLERETSVTAPLVCVPLADVRTFRLPDLTACRGGGEDGQLIYVGARGMLSLLDLLRELPRLEVIDLSNVASWYTVDAFARTRDGAPTGNDVVRRLCAVVRELPVVRVIDLGRQPVGTLAAHELLNVIQSCRRLVEVTYCHEGVAMELCRAIELALGKNRAAAAMGDLPPEPALPDVLPQYLRQIPILDRKTLREQQLLRRTLMEEPAFADVLSEEELSELVLHARLMSTVEVLRRCADGGLRGDGTHLFVLKDGSLHASTSLEGLHLGRGDFFGDTYDQDMYFAAFRLTETRRGVVYAIPLDCCGGLLKVWEGRVRDLYGRLRLAPMMQVLDAWTRIRLCTCGRLQHCEPEEVVLRAGDVEAALWIVWSGFFEASSGSIEDKVATGRYTPYPFASMDVFGVECLVARRHCSSVTITAGKPKENVYTLVVVRGSAVHIIKRCLATLLIALALPYSLHEDLRRTALQGPAVESPMHKI